MRSRTLVAKSALLFFACGILSLSSFAQDATWQKDTAAWRAAHKAVLLKPDGWLSLAGLEWLQPGDNSVGSAAGDKIHLAAGPAHLAVLHLDGETVTLNPPAGGFPPDFLVAGAPAKSQSLRAQPHDDKVSPPLTVGLLTISLFLPAARSTLP